MLLGINQVVCLLLCTQLVFGEDNKCQASKKKKSFTVLPLVCVAVEQTCSTIKVSWRRIKPGTVITVFWGFSDSQGILIPREGWLKKNHNIFHQNTIPAAGSDKTSKKLLTQIILCQKTHWIQELQGYSLVMVSSAKTWNTTKNIMSMPKKITVN